jgi:hypothetical protein
MAIIIRQGTAESGRHMGADAQNLTGVWQGLCTYPNGESASFVATLIDGSGALSGSTHEPCAGGLLERHVLCDARRQPKRQRRRIPQDLRRQGASL